MSTGHIRQRGAGSWELRFELPRDPDGKRRTRTTTVKGSKRDAQRELRRLLNEVDAGTHVDKSKTTLAALLADSIEQWQASGRITSRTAQRYRDDMKNYIAPHLGQREIQKLTTLDLEKWHGTLLSAGGRRGGLATLTVRGAHRLLGQVLARAVKHGLVARNVAALERAPAPERDEITILLPEQIAPMLEKLSGHPMHAPVVAALYTGIRRGEMLAIKWADVDLDAGMLTVARALEETRAHGVRVKAPKSERGTRRISLPALVVRVLRAHRRRAAGAVRRDRRRAHRPGVPRSGRRALDAQPLQLGVAPRGQEARPAPGHLARAPAHARVHADRRRRRRGHDQQAARARDGRLHAPGLRPRVPAQDDRRAADAIDRLGAG